MVARPVEDARTHDDDDQVRQKKVSKLPILILIPVSQNPFYVYQSKHDFLEIHNGRGKFWPSKGATKDSSRFASSPRLKLSVQKRMSYLLRTDWHASLNL
jgi:hypothetical protein